jgi:opacity protein-like surface antigen
MSRFVKTLVVLAGVTISGLAMAQSADREGTWETRLGVTFDNSTTWDFDGGTTAKLDSSTGFLLGFAYHYTDSLEFGADLEFDQQDYDARIASGTTPGLVFPVSGSSDNFRLMLNGTYNFMPGKFSPFVMGAVGWTWMDTNIATSPPQTGCWWDPWWGYICTTYQNTKTIDGLTYRLGVGLRYDISDQFAVHAAYRYTWTDIKNASGTPDQDGFLLSVGWKF